MGITATFEALGTFLADAVTTTVVADTVGAGVVDAATLAEGFGGAGALGVGGAAGLTGLEAATVAAGAGATALDVAGGTAADTGSSLYSLSGGPGAGGGLVAPTGGGAGLTSLADMGGAGGLNAAAGGTSLESMGGASGLLAPAAGGAGVVGADGLYAGVGAGYTGTLGSSLAGIPSALTGTVADAAANGTTVPGGGSNLSSLLTPTNAALASGLGSLAGGVVKNDAISASIAQQQAAAAASQGVLNSTYNKSMGFQVPYQAAGANAINQIGAMGTGDYTQYDMNGNPTGTGTGSGYLQHQFNKDDLAAGLAPNYDFMLQQGQNVNQRAANVGGGALSGNTLQGLQNYTQNYAGNAYQNAFTNYQAQRQNIYGNLAGIAGIGQAANAGAVGAANNYADNTTKLTTGIAAANAAATMGQGTNTANTISNIGNAAYTASLLNQQQNAKDAAATA